jgi:hypothetical protein
VWLLAHRLGYVAASPAPSLVGSFIFTSITSFAIAENRKVGMNMRVAIILWELAMMLISLRGYKYNMRDIQLNLAAFAAYLAFLRLSGTSFHRVYFEDLPKSAQKETLGSYVRKRLSL